MLKISVVATVTHAELTSEQSLLEYRYGNGKHLKNKWFIY